MISIQNRPKRGRHGPNPQSKLGTPTDYDDLADIDFDAVRNGPSKYTQSQRAAWVPERRHGEEWAARLEGQVIAMARDETRAVGFVSLARTGDDGKVPDRLKNFAEAQRSWGELPNTLCASANSA